MESLEAELHISQIYSLRLFPSESILFIPCLLGSCQTEMWMVAFALSVFALWQHCLDNETRVNYQDYY